MHCSKCNAHYDDPQVLFCPRCGGKVVPDAPQAAKGSGVNLTLGDANAISGGVHLTDSHNVANIDNSVHNTSNVTNITNVAAQKSDMELLRERKTLYLNACKRAYEDNVLEQAEVISLEECRIKLGLDKATADAILDSVRIMSERNARKTELNPIARTKLKVLTANLQKNEVKTLMQQIDSLEALVKKYNHDELTRKYYLVLAALKCDKCIELYESSRADNYWQSFWSYLAYIKADQISEAENILASLDRFTDYPEDNMTILAVAGAIMMGDKETAKDLLGDVTGDYTPALQRFVDSIYLLLEPETAKELGADENTCAFYLVNYFRPKYTCHPKDKFELRKILEKRLAEDKNADLNDIDVSGITDMGEEGLEDKRSAFYIGLFEYLDPHNIEISMWDVSNVKDMHSMFSGCKNFNCDLSKWDVSNVEDMGSMFWNCQKFEGKGLENWKVYNVEHMSLMFQNCKNFDSDLSKWNVRKVEDMDRMFHSCENFNSDLSKWDVSNVENMNHMFCGCRNFNCGLSNWDVHRVKYMNCMFYSCENFNSDLSKWDVSNVEGISAMFENCKNFDSDLSKWNVSNVKDVEYNMLDVFAGCTSLRNIPSWYKK